MAHKEITQYQYTCDACPKTVISAVKGTPQGWKVEGIELASGTGGFIKGIDLCPDCLRDIPAAKVRAKAAWGQ